MLGKSWGIRHFSREQIVNYTNFRQSQNTAYLTGENENQLTCNSQEALTDVDSREKEAKTVIETKVFLLPLPSPGLALMPHVPPSCWQLTCSLVAHHCSPLLAPPALKASWTQSNNSAKELVCVKVCMCLTDFPTLDASNTRPIPVAELKAQGMSLHRGGSEVKPS